MIRSSPDSRDVAGRGWGVAKGRLRQAIALMVQDGLPLGQTPKRCGTNGRVVVEWGTSAPVMSDERTIAASPEGEEERPAAVISAQSATRLVLVLLTIWTAFSGIALIFQEGSAATIG